jgi:hypothetical protein
VQSAHGTRPNMCCLHSMHTCHLQLLHHTFSMLLLLLPLPWVLVQAPARLYMQAGSISALPNKSSQPCHCCILEAGERECCVNVPAPFVKVTPQL